MRPNAVLQSAKPGREPFAFIVTYNILCAKLDNIACVYIYTWILVCIYIRSGLYIECLSTSDWPLCCSKLPGLYRLYLLHPLSSEHVRAAFDMFGQVESQTPLSA